MPMIRVNTGLVNPKPGTLGPYVKGPRWNIKCLIYEGFNFTIIQWNCSVLSALETDES